jgi:hypothetical protein
MKTLQQTEQLFGQGKFPMALKLLDQLETQKNRTELEQLQGQLLRCRILAHQDVPKAQELAEQILPPSQALNQPIIQVDAILIMAEAWLEWGLLETSKKWIDQAKTVLASLPNRFSPQSKPRAACVRAPESGSRILTAEYVSSHTGLTRNRRFIHRLEIIHPDRPRSFPGVSCSLEEPFP